MGHSVMWVCHFKYLLHNWTWLNTFHIRRISRPHSCKGPRAWNSAAGRGAHLCVVPNNAFLWPAPVLSVPRAPESKWILSTSLFCTQQSFSACELQKWIFKDLYLYLQNCKGILSLLKFHCFASVPTSACLGLEVWHL